MDSRARRPYPPVLTDFAGSLAPASVVNLDPIPVAWKRRDRLSATITLASEPSETVEAGTEYWVRFGPPGFTEEIKLGDATDESGEFNLSFKGYNEVEVFTRLGGLDSKSFAFETNALNGAGASVAAALPSVGVQMLLTASVTVSVTVGLPTVNVQFVEPVDFHVEDMPTITVEPIEGFMSTGPDVADIGEVSLIAPEAYAIGGVAGEGIGALGTITLTAPTGILFIDGFVRVTQEYAEVIRKDTGVVRVTQEYAEVIRSIT